MRRVRRAVALGAALLLTACASGPSGGGPPAPGGLLVVTAGGTALVDGADDVPPTLDLRVSAAQPLTRDDVQAQLDGTSLRMSATSRDAVVASVPPMPLGSVHRLDLDVTGRSPTRIGFHVVAAAGAMAALHTDPRDGTVLDLVVQLPPQRRAVEAALPGGATIAWLDDSHLRATWPAAPGGTFELMASLRVSRGSHLAGALRLPLAAVDPGAVRLAVIPDAAAPKSKPMVVAFTAATARSRASLQAHIGQVSLVSPTGVGVSSDGSLTGSPDAAAVGIAGAGHVPVWPLLQNDASDSAGIAGMLENPDAVRSFVATARQLAAAGRFPGLHLDIEGVPATERDHLTALIGALAGGLHADGRRLAVAVVPHKPQHLNVYSAAYDLRVIGRVADLVTLMAYDQHTSLTEAGPVAGLAWDRHVLDGSLPELQSTSTALLGLPLYARTWGSDGVVADSYAASLSAALQSAGARLDYDFTEATPFVHNGDGSATTWFDDAASLAAKVSLAGSAQLRGVALWRLGFEDPALWAVLPSPALRV